MIYQNYTILCTNLMYLIVVQHNNWQGVQVLLHEIDHISGKDH